MDPHVRKTPSPLRQWWTMFLWVVGLAGPIAFGCVEGLLSIPRTSQELQMLLGAGVVIPGFILEFMLAALPGAIARTRGCENHRKITIAGYVGLAFAPLLPAALVWALVGKKLPPGSRMPL